MSGNKEKNKKHNTSGDEEKKKKKGSQAVGELGSPFDTVKRLMLVNKNILGCDDLSFCQFLERIELQQNKIRKLDFLQDARDTTYLNISHNKVDSLQPVVNMAKLKVLNAGYNELRVIPANFVSTMSELRALLLNNNQLRSLPRSSKNQVELKTLVLSDNEIEDLVSISRYPSLEKISASNNVIRAIPEEIKELKQLEELRLAHNKIVTLPNGLVECARLKILNLTHNFIQSFEYVCKKKKVILRN